MSRNFSDPSRDPITTLINPFDSHVHARSGAIKQSVVPATARTMSGAIFMPNIAGNPIDSVEKAEAYVSDIYGIDAYVLLYLNRNTSIETVRAVAASRASKKPIAIGFKWYPEGVTTNSTEQAFRSYSEFRDILSEMEKLDVPLSIHPEDPSERNPLERELSFMSNIFPGLRKKHPSLTIILEHISTSAGISTVACSENTYGTITAHHALADINDLMGGKLNPHLFCKPVLQIPEHRRAVVAVPKSYAHSNKYFLGSDTAPWPVYDKESEAISGGCYTAPHVLELYFHAFTEVYSPHDPKFHQAFSNFCTLGRKIYKLPDPAQDVSVTIRRTKGITIPNGYSFGNNGIDNYIRPAFAGLTLKFTADDKQPC